MPYSFDDYSNGSDQAWVCVEVGSTVDSRVVIPLGVPSVSGNPGYDVSWYPDPGTP